MERILLAVLRWGVRRLRSLYAAAGLALTLALALAVAAVWGFGVIAELALRGEPAAFELAVLRWLQGHSSPRLDRIVVELTALGSNLTLGALALVAGTLFWLERRRHSALVLWAAVAGSMVLNRILKWIFARPRPELGLVPWPTHFPGTESFPSGHAMTSAVTYLLLAYLVARLQRTVAARAATLVVATVLVLAIGGSRLYLGAHYPSDVAAGFAIGFAWAAVAALVARVLGAIPDPSPVEDARGEPGGDRGAAGDA